MIDIHARRNILVPRLHVQLPVSIIASIAPSALVPALGPDTSPEQPPAGQWPAAQTCVEHGAHQSLRLVQVQGSVQFPPRKACRLAPCRRTGRSRVR